MRTSHQDYELIRPLVFNFKQGIELYVKGLAGLFVGEYAFCHDIREIFEQGIQRAKTSSAEYKFFTDLHREHGQLLKSIIMDFIFQLILIMVILTN